MNYRILLPMLGACALTFQACNSGKMETYYDNDQVKERWTEVSNAQGVKVKQGLFEAFDEKGNKRDSVVYEQGKREGTEIKWAADGKKTFVSNWTNGQANGRFEEYAVNGKLIKVTTLKLGIPDGPEFSYNKQGVMIEEKHFKNGIQDSVYHRWNDKGEMKQQAFYMDGKLHGVQLDWCEEDKYRAVLRDSVNIVMGKRQGVEVYHLCLNGELSSILTWKDDHMDGAYTHWDEGKKIVEIYQDGKCIRNCPKAPVPPPQ